MAAKGTKRARWKVAKRRQRARTSLSIRRATRRMRERAEAKLVDAQALVRALRRVKNPSRRLKALKAALRRAAQGRSYHFSPQWHADVVRQHQEAVRLLRNPEWPQRGMPLIAFPGMGVGEFAMSEKFGARRALEGHEGSVGYRHALAREAFRTAQREMRKPYRAKNPLDFPTLATGAALGAGSFAASALLGAVTQKNGRRRRRRR